MELILLQDISGLGLKGDAVQVREGFARNFLLPRGLAVPFTRGGQRFVEEHKARLMQKRAKEKTEAEDRGKELEQLKLTIGVAVGEKDKLFGSVTAEDIRQALSERGYSVEKKRISLKEPIRTLGSHAVTIDLYPQVKATVSVEVVRKS